MTIKRYTLVYILTLLLPIICWADSHVISIGVADFPPYSIVEGRAISGAEVDIIRESLTIMGYKVKFVTYPYGRLPTAFSNKKVDVTIVTPKNFTGLDVYYSEIVLPEYQTVAVHLHNKDYQIDSISDLRNKSIVAHQRASLFYGDEFKSIADTAEGKGKYKETARQESQILMLFKERVDVIVLAHDIFAYYKARSEYKNTHKEYVVSKVFGEKFGFHNAFWDHTVRNDFNSGLNLIKANGIYSKILQTYLEEYKPQKKPSKTLKLASPK